MNRLIKSSRLVAMLCMLILLVSGYFVALYKLQIVEGAAYYEQSQNNIVSTHTVTAARGNILDRYGRVLVSNRTCNNLTFNTDELFEQEDPNSIILQLVETVTSFGDTYTDELPITKVPPFEYVDNMTDLQRTRLEAYIEYNIPNGLPENPTAVELMAFFRSRYEIDNNYTAEETRIIAGIRYELNLRYVVGTSPYVFVEDASIDLISRIMEQNLQGINVEVSYIREYETIYAAHLLGYVGEMDGVAYEEKYADLGYPMDALVGRSGAELAFEEYLHGTDGTSMVTSTASGTVTSTVYTQEPEPGNHVYLTIDIGLQEAAEQALSSYITQQNEVRQAAIDQEELYGGEATTELITGGAVVAIQVDTGEPLAIASWPTYNLSTFMEDYNELSEDPNYPLVNKALTGLYTPGSTFKPCTALALLDSGTITPNTTTYDEVVFRKYEDSGYAPKCWISSRGGSHGLINVSGALKYSCNYFFYTWADLMGISTLDKYAAKLGLGEKTGIELGEETGHMASPEYMEEVADREWYAGDTLQAAIGQSVSQFTPIQLANYIATIANGGTRNTTSILKSVRSYDYSENLYERTPEAAEVISTAQANWDAIRQGMYDVANAQDGTAYSIFGNYAYCTVAAKTGTAETGENSANDATFVCYAPADDPEIAVCVVVENGDAGSAIGGIARDVLDYYFSFQNSTSTPESELSLLR
jgi:penicillin-binding protein 2